MRRLTSTARSNTERGNTERGAVLVELAMVVPVLVILVLGMIEVGRAWSTSSLAYTSTRQGARVGSHLGDGDQADREALRAIEAAFGDAVPDIERVILFEATGRTEPPLPCLAATTTYLGVSECNVYSGATVFSHLDTDLLWGCSAAALDRNWCPTGRDDGLASADHLGVYVEFRHDWVTGFFPGDGRTIVATTIMRLEPAAAP